MNHDWPRHWLFLRGLSRETGHWGDFPQQCQQALGWQIECLDLPGFGDQHLRLSATNIVAITADLRRRADLPADANIGLLALSLGGMVAMEWAAQAPDHITALVLINSSSADCPLWQRLRLGALPPVLNSLGSRSIKRQESAILNMVSNHHGNDPAVLNHWVHLRQQRRLTKTNVIRQLLAAARYASPAASRLAHLKAGMILSSRGDRMVSWRCSEFLARKYQLPLKLHHSAGHDLPLDEPKWLIAALAAGLDSPQ